MPLEAGIGMERSFVIGRENTAAAVAERDDPEGPMLPEVWSTPDMIGKMEVVCAALAAAGLATGQMTVGSRIEASHLGATAIGSRVQVQATLTAVDGRKLSFAVAVFDEVEKVGEATHVRYIVDVEKFDSRLRAKCTR